MFQTLKKIDRHFQITKIVNEYNIPTAFKSEISYNIFHVT